jgi:hypothetical protein
MGYWYYAGVDKLPECRSAATAVFSTGYAQLGLINTTVKVFGAENVAVIDQTRYGWESAVPLDTLFEHKPPQPDQPYHVRGIEARIDKSLALSWEEPAIILGAAPISENHS